jgi:hypothetical protein
MRKVFLSTFFTLSLYALSLAQVQYSIKLEPDGQTYTVCMKSSVAYNTPQSQIPTAQVTVVAPHGTGGTKFTVTGLTSYEASMQWGQNARVDAPSENPSKDYISFGFQGATTFNIPLNTEKKLFSFKNSGTCLGALQLIVNGIDPFDPPTGNSQNTNPGNAITILGAGGDAYTGNYGTGANACAGVVANDDSKTVSANTVANIVVLSNDTNADGTAATLVKSSAPTVTTLPTKGTVTVKADGSIDYMPNNGATGTDSFVYQICDKTITTNCDTATVTLTLPQCPTQNCGTATITKN